MTLLKQLLAMIVLLFTMLFIGSFSLSIENTRSYLNNQMRTISQDTATSLGMSLSPHIGEHDYIMVERMVSAVSDSGYYRQVLITDVDGKTIINKTQQVNLNGVPNWFINMFKLETPHGEALIMSGWQQAGMVKVLVNPGYAYVALWTSATQFFMWFASMTLLASVLGVIALYYILNPLRNVEAQARSICDREYPIQTKLPWTIELRSVVEAMNLMTNKVRQMFEEQSESIERLRSENYLDSLTNLFNRRYFNMQLEYLIKTGEDGAIILVELKDFKEYNKRRGFQAGDELLRNTASFINAICKAQPNHDYFVAHLSGASFAIVISHIGEQESRDIGEKISNSLTRFKERGFVDTDDVGHIGIALFSNETYSELMSAADLALRTAQQEGPNAMHLVVPSKSVASVLNTSTQWGDVLRDALQQNRLSLLMQPLKDSTATILHYEALMRLTDIDGKIIPAMIYTQMANRHGLAMEFDKVVITEVLVRLIAKRYGDVPIAVNIFPSSVQNNVFVDWFCAELAKNPEAASRMLIEVSEYGALENVEALRDFIKKIAAYGARVGLDHFGRGLTSFGYLRKLKLDYIKIDGGYVNGIVDNKDNQFMIESVAKVAHSLDMKVYGVSVEDADQWKLLVDLHVDGVLGYGVGRPEYI